MLFLGLLFLLFFRVYEIHKSAILQLSLVLADVLGEGIGRALVGVVDGLDSPLAKGVVGTAAIDGHAA